MKEKNSNTGTQQQSIVSKNTTLVGDIDTDSALRIDGSVEGNITTKNKVVVGKEGTIKGTLNGVNASIEGRFSGKLTLSGTLSLKATAHVDGEVQTNKLVVEPGALFNATCTMGGAVKNLNETPKRLPKSEKTAQA